MAAEDDYKSRFLGDFNMRSSKDEAPGSAEMSQIEWKVYRDLIASHGKEGARKIIEETGVPLVGHEILPEDLGETAYKHLCVVAPYLLDTRGAEASPVTVESYVTKNRFDRFMYLELVRAGRVTGKENIGQKGDLDDQWFSPQERQFGYKNEKMVQYPEGVDSTKIFGVAKPHRYWPAQMMRYIEFIRLGKMSKKEMNDLEVGNTGLDKYAIEWNNFPDVIKKEKTLDDITAGIAVKTAEILKSRGLSEKQISKLLLAGYSPGGPLTEHGNIDSVHEIWSNILNRISRSETVKDMKEELKIGVEEKMVNTGSGYEFKYDPAR